ncbi:MAG: gamma carbonic anhydrase family protein [Oxalobacteraceae bacterium]|nr:MAG: gamma carbonic anhydrase family protein [Oxalobacteraceae bacterium]
MLFELSGVLPRVDDDAWVAPNATVIGDVWLGAGSTVWFGAVLRGDTNRICIGQRSNVQDNTVIHVNAGAEWACTIGDDVTIGHACIIHACTLHDRAFVGMGATVLDGAVIESGGMLAAGGLLTPGKRIPAGELWAGSPARKMRDIPAADRAGLEATTASYVRQGQRYRAGLKRLD